MLSELFKDLLAIEGIEAAVIYGPDNQVLDSWSIAHFNTQIFKEIGLSYLQIFSITDQMSRSFSETVVMHEKGQIFARSSDGLLLVVIAKLKVEVSLIRLFVNVGFAEYASSKKLQKIVRKISRGKEDFLNPRYLDSTEQKYLDKIEK